MIKNVVKVVNLDDWVEIHVNGVEVLSGHSINPLDLLDVFDRLGCEVEYTEEDNEAEED